MQISVAEIGHESGLGKNTSPKSEYLLFISPRAATMNQSINKIIDN